MHLWKEEDWEETMLVGIFTQFKLNHLSYLEDHGPVGAIGRDSLNLNWCT